MIRMRATPPPTHPPKRLFCEVGLESAVDLLKVLSPELHQDYLWNRWDDGDWIFRGQAEAVWKLEPSSQRQGDPFQKFVPGQIVPRQLTPMDRMSNERDYVLQFNGRVTVKGLEVPGDSQDLRDRLHDANDGVEFPPVAYRGMYALAQHNGVPTRLLDWSRKPLVAAYFAAERQARRIVKGEGPLDTKSDGRLAIWALQRSFVPRRCRGRDWEPGVAIVTVPTTSNPNLALQAGLFTLVFKRSKTSIVLPGEGDLPTLDDLFQRDDNIAKANVRLPMLYKFTIPQAEAPHLLYYLDRHDVNAATVFAGHGAITDYLVEAAYRARPEGPHTKRPGTQTDAPDNPPEKYK